MVLICTGYMLSSCCCRKKYDPGRGLLQTEKDQLISDRASDNNESDEQSDESSAGESQSGSESKSERDDYVGKPHFS